MINFLHTFIPSSVAFTLGPLAVHWYGLFVVSGILAGILVAVQMGKKYNISANQVFDLGFYIVIAGIIGARVYSVFLDLPYYLQHPAQIIAVWNGGLAIHGAIIGGTLALVVYVRKNKQNFWQWADLAALAVPLGQAFGRWGNYFNQEIFGTPTNLPWGIPIEAVHRPTQYASFEYFHPTFLYESILNLLNFFILVWLFNRNQKSEIRNQSGVVFLAYLFNYAVIRISMEFLRTDPASKILGIRWPIIFSSAVLLAVVVIFVWRRKSPKAVI